MTDKLTVFDIMDKLEETPQDQKAAVLDRLLSEYDGDDKELIEPDLRSSIAMTGNLKAI